MVSSRAGCHSWHLALTATDSKNKQENHLIICYRIYVLKIPSLKLYVLYVFNIYANWMLFTIQCITHFLCIILNYKNLNLNN